MKILRRHTCWSLSFRNNGAYKGKTEQIWFFKRNCHGYNTGVFEIVTGILPGGTLAPYLLIIFRDYVGGACGVMVIVVGNEHGDTSSNPGRD